jgi:uroporphyrinogen-III synthase
VSLLRNNALDAVTLSSSEGLRNLTQLLDTGAFGRLSALPVFVPHQRLAEEASRLGLRRVALAGPTDGGLVAGMCSYRWTEQRTED